MARYTSGDAYMQMAVESTYGSVGSPFSNKFPLIGGGDNLVEVSDVVPRRGVWGRSPRSTVRLRVRSEGAESFDYDYDKLGRILYAALGAKETDNAASPLSGLYDNFFSPADVMPSLSLNIYRGGSLFAYYGCVVNSLTIAQSAGDPMTMEVEFLGKTSPVITADATAPTYPTFAPVLPSHNTVFTVISEALTALLKGWSITVNNNLDGGLFNIGQTGRSIPVRRGAMDVTGSLDLDVTDEVATTAGTDGLLDSWRNSESGTLSATWNNGGASTAVREFEVYCPNVIITGDPFTAQDFGAYPATINFMAIDGTISAGTLGTIDAGSNLQMDNTPIAFRASSDEDAATF